MPAVRVGALIGTYVFHAGARTSSSLLIPAKAAIANIYAFGAGARGAQREDFQYVIGGGGGAHAGLLGYEVKPGQSLYMSVPGYISYNTSMVPACTVMANDNSTVICRAVSGRDGEQASPSSARGRGGAAIDCIGDYAFNGGDGYINTSNTNHYGGGGGGAGTEGAGGNGQGGPGYQFAIAGAAGQGRTFIDTENSSYQLSPGAGGSLYSGSSDGNPIGGGGAARNPSGNSWNGARGAVAIDLFEAAVGGTQLFIL